MYDINAIDDNNNIELYISRYFLNLDLLFIKVYSFTTNAVGNFQEEFA